QRSACVRLAGRGRGVARDLGEHQVERVIQLDRGLDADVVARRLVGQHAEHAVQRDRGDQGELYLRIDAEARLELDAIQRAVRVSGVVGGLVVIVDPGAGQ